MAEESSQNGTKPGDRKKLIEVNNLVKYFPVRAGLLQRVQAWVKAVDDVSFFINEGETFGLVGESGCGKTTVGRTILRLIPSTSGEVLFRGENIFAQNASELKKMRADMQIIFQDPYSSLDPRMPDEAAKTYADDPRTAVVTLTHDPRLDDLALMQALTGQSFYTGALGSRVTSAKRCERLLALGLPPEAVARLHAPVGIEIGSRTPAEIAISILAEITAVRRALERSEAPQTLATAS